MSLRLIKDLQFTQIEFGALYTIYESLKTAKTKKAIVKLTADSKEIEIFQGL